MEQNVDSLIDEFMMLNINNYMRDNNFYSDLYNNLTVTSKKFGLEYKSVYQKFLLYLSKWNNTLLSSSLDVYGQEQTDNLRFMLHLVSYPLINMLNIKNKKYSDFNINLDFFSGVYINNSKIIDDEGIADNINILYSFEFDSKNKLNTFSIKNSAGITWIYDKNYIVKKIIFIDGKQMKINVKTKK